MMRRLSSLYTQHWYMYCVSLSPWKRYSLVLIVLSLCAGAWFFLVYCPLKQTQYSCEQELQRLHDTCRDSACATTMCTQLEDSIATLKNSLNIYQKTDTSPLILCVELAHKAGLAVHACTIGQGTHGQKKEMVTIELSGSTQAYMTFLKILAQLPQIIIYEQMHSEYAHASQIRTTCVLGFITF